MSSSKRSKFRFSSYWILSCSNVYSFRSSNSLILTLKYFSISCKFLFSYRYLSSSCCMLSTTFSRPEISWDCLSCKCLNSLSRLYFYFNSLSHDSCDVSNSFLNFFSSCSFCFPQSYHLSSSLLSPLLSSNNYLIVFSRSLSNFLA